MSKEWTPGKLLEISGGYWQTAALHAGVKLDVFSALEGRGADAQEAALKIGADRRALEMLLNALTAMGLLEKEGTRYANSPAATELLVRSSDRYQGHILLHHHHLMASWARLPEAVRTGAPVRGRASWSDAEYRESFLMGMFNLAMNLAPQLVGQIDLGGRRRLLDLGGGPGTWAIHFCLANPELTATVFDLPTTRPFAEKTIAHFGLSDRIDFASGDYLETGVEGSYQVAWLSHILHAEGPEGCRRILERAVSSLEPGGLILIHEFILDDDGSGPLFPALFSLNMLLGTESGRSYTGAQIEEMLREAGVKEVRRLPLKTPGESGIMAGVV